MFYPVIIMNNVDTSTIALSSVALQFTVGTVGTVEGRRLEVLAVVATVVVDVVPVSEMQVFTDGMSGTGTLII